MTMRHRVFVSYHHESDEHYRTMFEERFGDQFDAIVPGSVKIGDIDPNDNSEATMQKIREQYLRNTSVTVVLIGKHTWQRKFVDWEISYSLRATRTTLQSGLIGLILPTYDYPNDDHTKYNRKTIPGRLLDNLDCKYATIQNWNSDPRVIQRWIHEAFLARNNPTKQPHNRRRMLGNNLYGPYRED